MAGRTFSASSRGTLTRTLSPLVSVLITRTCSQRSCDTDAVGWVELAGATADCAKTPSGEKRTAAAMRAVLAKKPLLRSDMTGCLLTGSGPVLGDRYERGGKKVSEKIARTKKPTTNPKRRRVQRKRREEDPPIPSVRSGPTSRRPIRSVIWPA